MIFSKKQVIKHDGQYWQCVVVDDTLAVFAPCGYQTDSDGTLYWRVRYEGMFAVANHEENESFEYKTIDNV